MWKGLVAFLVVAVGVSDAHALVKAGPGVVGGGLNVRLGPAQAAPLDAFTQPAGAYSFRKLRSAYAGPAMRIQRGSDSAVLDIGFLGFTGFTGAPIDVAAAQAHCAATTCWIETWYDQSGNGRNAARSGSVVLLVFDCLGTQPCARSTDNPQFMSSANVALTATGAVSVVANRASGVGYCSPASRSTMYVQSHNSANNWLLIDTGSSNTFTFAAADNAWHAITANFAGASSVARVDSAETTGTVAGTAGTGPLTIAQGAFNTTSQCNTVEAVIWDNYALTSAERAALTANQHSFWGF